MTAHLPPQQRPYPVSYPPPPAKPKSFWSTNAGILIITFGSIGVAFAFIVTLAGISSASKRAAADKVDVSVTSCEGSSPVATLGYTVTNTDTRAHRVTLDIEYRDSSGARLDTDTAYVRSVPAGDTVRGEESTILDASAPTVTCKVVGIKVD